MSDSDDEYGPLQATWGSQAPAPAPTQTPSDTAETWDALKDPNAKLNKKGLGTGQLHRKGKNFKPIDEDIIIAQRLNKNSSTKKKNNTGRQSQDNISSGSNNKKNHSKDYSRKTSTSSASSPPAQHQRGGGRKKPSLSTPTSPPMRPASSLSQTRRPTRPTNNAWSQPLVDTPFWESDLPNIPSPESTYQSNPTTTTTSSQSFSNSINTTTTTNTNNNNNNTSNTNYNNNNDTQQHSPQNTSNNNGWGKPLPRNKVFVAATTNTTTEQKASSVTDNWDTPVGGWSNTVDQNVDNTNGWNSNNNNNNNNQKQQQKQQDGWGISKGATISSLSPPQSSTASNGGWGALNNDTGNTGWGSAPAEATTDINNSDNGGWGKSNLSTPSWLDSVPEDTSSFSPPQQQQREIRGRSTGGRFSNKARKKYSDIPIEVPKPRNYDTSEPVSFPTAVAPPPPPDNDHLITINVELSDTIKVAVAIHELDEPLQLAEKFASEQQLTSPQILQALVKLFTSQKETALSKKRQRLVKKYPSRPHPTNYYTDAFEYPEYLPTVYNNAPSLTTPFTRRAYY